ncbi:MAG: YbaK/prolyl-tRNA synthetase associated region [Rhodoferax sp.]|nr:YbaK/prolyl-tRNA synthetase associated region [Rhodoferax sp.]
MTTPTPDTAPVSYLNEEAIQLVLERANTVAAAGDRVPSPCISVCRVNADSGLCEGCFRTLGEISSWGRSSPDAQRALWQTIRQRIALAQG